MKCNRKNHIKSNWMTIDILNYINTKNALYKTLIKTSPTNEDVHTRLKPECTEYRAKRLYYFENICHSQE